MHVDYEKVCDYLKGVYIVWVQLPMPIIAAVCSEGLMMVNAKF